MSEKNYTLYFKGTNKYGHEHTIKLLSLNLKQLDEYTSNYKDFLELFNSLNDEIKIFIKEKLSYKIDLSNNEEISECFFITDEDFSPIMDIIFESDRDVLYVTLDELTKMIINVKISPSDYQTIALKSKINEKVYIKYVFFKYLYNTYVLDKKISCMIDVYDTNKKFSNLAFDELMIASIATDKDNIMVLCKKLGQCLESRRNLALKYKKLYGKIKENSNIIEENSIMDRKNKNINIPQIKDSISKNFKEFKTAYVKEYEVL